MSTPPSPGRLDGPAGQVQPPGQTSTDGLSSNLLDENAERRVDEIEMIGEEEAAGLTPPGHSSVTIGMRYLHSSRTIHQLINDRNRSVGLYLAVASLLWTGSAYLLNARPQGKLLVPMEEIQLWCLPLTFLVLAVMALIVGLLLVRTRVGLIYEVAKMNVLLGLPIGRVQRINPLSLFFLMHLTISLAGGLAGGLFTHQLLRQPLGPNRALVWSCVVAVVFALFLLILYIAMVQYTTADSKLQNSGRQERS
jgi:hypothetical protein